MTASDIARNVEHWGRVNAEYTGKRAREFWAADALTWSMFGVLEDELRVLPDLGGLDVVEIGCGTAYFAARLARRGARVVGVDPTPAQLESARAMQREFGLRFPLVEAAGEEIPLPDCSFDLAVSGHGASTWADPYEWISEAARLLRPGGLLVFVRSATLLMLCSPDDGQAEERLLRPQFGMHRLERPDGAVEFHLAHGDLIRLLREHGFEVEDLIELQAPADAETHGYYDYVTADWARRWPAEEIWKARKRP